MDCLSVTLLQYKYLGPNAGPSIICECIETDVACHSNGPKPVFDHGFVIDISREFLRKKENVNFIGTADWILERQKTLKLDLTDKPKACPEFTLLDTSLPALGQANWAWSLREI